jgi:hypothetical protein
LKEILSLILSQGARNTVSCVPLKSITNLNKKGHKILLVTHGVSNNCSNLSSVADESLIYIYWNDWGDGYNGEKGERGGMGT